MIKTILAPGLSGLSTSKAMTMALQVARLFDGHIEQLHIHPNAAELARYTVSLDIESGVFSGDIWQSLERADEARAALSRDEFTKFITNEKITMDSAVTATRYEASGNEIEETIHQAFYRDLVVFGRPEEPSTLSTLGVGDILLGCGRPLLLVPSRPCRNPITTAAIAWKPSPQSARAVSAAMPVLKKADRVFVLHADEDESDSLAADASTEQLAEYLRFHGVKAQTSHVKRDSRDTWDVILDASANELNAGILVMGGYGHSRARQLIFGGFTRQVLRQAALPVFLCH